MFPARASSRAREWASRGATQAVRHGSRQSWRSFGAAIAAEEVGEQFCARGDVKVAVEVLDVLADRCDREAHAKRRLLLAVPVEQAVERLPQPWGEARDRIMRGGQRPTQVRG